jgi:hypothetical protein
LSFELTSYVYLFIELSEKLLKRKVELCENILGIYSKVDPGQTTQRINVMFELHCAKVIEIKRKLLENHGDMENRNDANVS